MQILSKPNEILRKVSSEVKKDELKEVSKILDKMYDLMITKDDAVGLSAPQIGINKRFLISAIIKEKKIHYFYVINPVIIKKSTDLILDEEGCLSIPGINGYVQRPSWIEVEFRDIDWNLHKLKLSGLNARILLHEMDHLDGILFTDKIISFSKNDNFLAKKGNNLKVVFFGSPSYSISSLKYLMEKYNVVAVVSQPSKPVGRKKEITDSDVSIFAKKNGLKLFTPDNLKDTNFLENIKNLSPDIFVVVAYGKIIPQVLLDIPKYGAINLHGSILPKYRGASPIQQTLLNDDKKGGVTMQKMDIKMDEGNIIHIESINIDKNDNFITLSKKYEDLNIKCLSYLDDYISGKIMMSVQDHKKASYTNKITKDDGFIDISKETAAQIYNKYRAYIVWPKIYMFFNNKRLILHEISLENDFEENEKIGFFVEKNLLKLKTKKGTLIVHKLQLEGKNIMDGINFKTVLKNVDHNF